MMKGDNFGMQTLLLEYSYAISKIPLYILLTYSCSEKHELILPPELNKCIPTASQSSHELALSVDRSMHRWSDEDLQMMALWGNARANAYIHYKVVVLMVGTGEQIFVGK
jgi:hypothetical protein